MFEESADGFVLLKEVLDPTKGWLENDSLVVESGPTVDGVKTCSENIDTQDIS